MGSYSFFIFQHNIGKINTAQAVLKAAAKSQLQVAFYKLIDN